VKNSLDEKLTLNGEDHEDFLCFLDAWTVLFITRQS